MGNRSTKNHRLLTGHSLRLRTGVSRQSFTGSSFDSDPNQDGRLRPTSTSSSTRTLLQNSSPHHAQNPENPCRDGPEITLLLMMTPQTNYIVQEGHIWNPKKWMSHLLVRFSFRIIWRFCFMNFNSMSTIGFADQPIAYREPGGMQNLAPCLHYFSNWWSSIKNVRHHSDPIFSSAIDFTEPLKDRLMHLRYAGSYHSADLCFLTECFGSGR